MTKIQLYNITMQANNFLIGELSPFCHLKNWGATFLAYPYKIIIQFANILGFRIRVNPCLDVTRGCSLMEALHHNLKCK